MSAHPKTTAQHCGVMRPRSVPTPLRKDPAEATLHVDGMVRRKPLRLKLVRDNASRCKRGICRAFTLSTLCRVQETD